MMWSHDGDLIDSLVSKQETSSLDFTQISTKHARCYWDTYKIDLEYISSLFQENKTMHTRAKNVAL